MTTLSTILIIGSIVFVTVLVAEIFSTSIKKFVLKTKTHTDDELLEEIAAMHNAVLDYIDDLLGKKKKKK